MTARRLYVPAAMPSRDANGRALPARLRFYSPGAAYDTLATVYTSSALSTAHSQPVLSNAYGHFPEIWADSTTSFDVTYSDQVFDRQLRAFEAVTPLTDAAAASVALAESAELAAEDAQAAAEAAQALAEAAATAASNALGGLANVSNPLTPQNFGFVGTGTAADTARFLAWVAQLGAGIEGYVPPGTYNLDSATLGSAGISPNAKTSIRGVEGATKFVVTGTTPCNLFVIDNVGDFSIEGVWFYGNNQGTTYATGSAIYVTLSSGATQGISNFRVERCRFDNFKHNYWLSFINQSATYAMRNIHVEGNSFYSYSGNTQDPNDLGANAVMVNVNGNAAGGISNVWVRNNYADANWMKTFCAVFSYTTGAHLDGNIIDNAGQGDHVADKGAYAFLIYGSTSTPSRISITNNTVNSPFCNGVYAPQVAFLTVTGNTFSGQSDTASVTLPKAAVYAQGYNLVISNNIFFLNYCDVAVQGATAGGEASITVSGNTSAGCTGPIAFQVLSPATGSSLSWQGLTITGNTIKHATGRAIAFRASAAEGVQRAVITGNRLTASYGIDLNYSGIAAVLVSEIEISGNYIDTTANGVYAYATTRVSITGNAFHGNNSSAQVYGEDAVALLCTGNNHYDQTASVVYLCPGATGGLRDNNFWNCAALTGSGSTYLGYQIPAFSGYVGLFVQNLNLSSEGGAGKTYVTLGWTCLGTTTWKAVRAPDQNNTATA